MKYIIIALLMGVNANAGILDINFSKKWNINGVPVGHQAIAQGTSLSLLGTGTATKKLGVAKAKIFVVQYFAEKPIFFIRSESEALNSINQVGIVGIRLTFMRALDSVTVHDAINSYLTSNIVGTELETYKADINAILAAINTQDTMKMGDSIDIVAQDNMVQYQNSNGVITNIHGVNRGLTTKLMSMFIGATTDSDSRILKAQMLQDPVFTFGDKQ